MIITKRIDSVVKIIVLYITTERHNAELSISHALLYSPLVLILDGRYC